MLFLTWNGMSHLGTNKKVNEDRFVIAELRPSTEIQETNLELGSETIRFGRAVGKFSIVSDGSGDPDDAARASTIAVDSLVKFFTNEFQWSNPVDTATEDLVRNQILSAFWKCQETMVRESSVLRESRNLDMSASVALAWVCWPKLVVATVGNCRVLLVRDGKAHFTSVDHTIPVGALTINERTGSESLDDSGRNVLTSTVGGVSRGMQIQIHFLQLEDRDSFVLCTDGVTDTISNERLVEILSCRLGAAEACQTIIDEALLGGGMDNVTAVVAKLSESQPDEKLERQANVKVAQESLEIDVSETIQKGEKTSWAVPHRETARGVAKKNSRI